MTTILPGDKVLVTGANGFIAVWAINNLLERGYSVRGTIRSASKGGHLDNLFKAKYPGKWEWVIVSDITKEDAFDEAVKGIDGIIHMASPFNYEITSPEEAIQPAVNGTVGVLKSSKKFGANVKRIVITSSVAAVIEMGDMSVPRTFTEKDWNNQAPALVEANGVGAGPMTIYFASKSLAEKAAWDFYKNNEGKISWDMTVIAPPYVYGPILHEVASPEALNQSVLDWYKAVLAPHPSDLSAEEVAQELPSSFVDVRDLATAHILALEKEAAGGERLIVSNKFSVFQDWRDVVQDIVPRVQGTVPADRLAQMPKGVRGAGQNAVKWLAFDASKGKRVLGVTYRSMEETAEDALKDYLARGW